jgi:hypothetical protein
VVDRALDPECDESGPDVRYVGARSPAASSAVPGLREGNAAADTSQDAAPTASVATARAGQGRTLNARKLVGVLSDPLLRADKKSAFASLYASWRLDFDASKNNLGCERGRSEGLQCLFKTGTWALRRFNLPAIIELSTPTGDRRYATVVALDEQNATLDFGAAAHFPLSEIDPTGMVRSFSSGRRPC